MTRNRKLRAFPFKARLLAMGAFLAIYCLATPSMSGLILITAYTTAQAKAGGGGGSGSGSGHGSSGHGSSGHSSSSHGGNTHGGGPSGTGAPGAVGNNGANASGVSHPSTTPAEEGGGHGGHAPCSSAECP